MPIQPKTSEILPKFARVPFAVPPALREADGLGPKQGIRTLQKYEAMPKYFIFHATLTSDVTNLAAVRRNRGTIVPS